MLKKQGRKVLRGPRSIPNLRLNAGSRSASGSAFGNGGSGGSPLRPALPALGLPFQGVGNAGDGGLASPPLHSAGSAGPSHLAVPFPGEPPSASLRSTSSYSSSQAPQIALTEYGGDFRLEAKSLGSPGGKTAGSSTSPATRAAALTEGDVWGALLGTNDGPMEASPKATRKSKDLGLGLDIQQSAGNREPHDADVSESEGSMIDDGDTSISSEGSSGYGQARRRRRLQALKATSASPESLPGPGASPGVKFQNVQGSESADLGVPIRSASIGRGSWRSISPFGPAVVVKQPNLRKVASSGLRQARAIYALGIQHSQPSSATSEGKQRLLPTAGPLSSSSHGPSSPDPSEGSTPNIAESQTPRIHPVLREKPSFTSSSGSHRTARGAGSDAHTLIFGGEGPTDLEGLGEDAELVLQYPAEPLFRSNSPAIGSPSPDPLASERFPKAFLPYWERSAQNDPALIFDVFQTYSQADPQDQFDAKRLSLTAVPTGTTSAATEAHKRSDSVESFSAKGNPGSPAAAMSQGVENSPALSISSGDRSSRHLSTSTTQSSVGGGSGSTLPADDPRFAIWTIRGPDQPPVVSIGADAFTAQAQEDPVPVASPKATANPTSRFSIRVPATPETPGRERTRTFAQPSPFAGAGDSSDVATPVAAATEQRRKQNRTSNMREDVLLPLDRPTLLAATKSRLVAELTSEIDGRLLTDFFFTFRLYMTPYELFRLLSLRFQWALGAPCSPHDEARRRIVRVRTYTVLKYWLNNLFEYDFLSDGILRSELTKWLNAIAKDPILSDRPADLAIVKSLKKTVRELKQRFSRSGVGGLLVGEPGVMPASESVEAPNLPVDTATNVSTKASERGSIPIRSPRVQDDVDLVLTADDKKDAETEVDLPESTAPSRVNSLARTGRLRSGSESLAPSWLEQRRTSEQDQDRPDLTVQPFVTAPFTVFDDTAEAATFQPRSMEFGNIPAEESTPKASMVMQPASAVSNPLSKAFSNTVTRLTKIGRALGSRSTLTVPFSSESGVSTNEQDSAELTDLLADPRQLQSFIDAIRNAQNASIVQPQLESTAEVAEPTNSPRTSFQGNAQAESESSQSDSTNLDDTPGLSEASQSTPASSIKHRDSISGESVLEDRRDSASALGLGLGFDAREKAAVDVAPNTVFSDVPLPSSTNDALHRYTSNQTLRTVGSAEHPRSSGLAPAPALRDFASYTAAMEGPNIVQIDDIDLSSDEDDGVVRRALRRLPGARDLKTTNNIRDLAAADGRQSFDSFSMMSGHGPMHASYNSKPTSLVGSQRSGSFYDQPFGLAAPTFPDKIGTVTTELLDPDEALAGYELVKGFKLDMVESDDEEPGDVEAALRRLEGIIDEEKQREKARRVEQMFKDSQLRIAARERMSKRATVAILSEETMRDSAISQAPSRLGSIADSVDGEALSIRRSVDGSIYRSELGGPEIVEPDTPQSDDDMPESPKAKMRTYAEQRSPFLRSRPPLASPKAPRPPLPAGAAARAARPLTFGAVPGVDLLRPSGRTTRQGRVLMTNNGAAGASSSALSAASVAASTISIPRPQLNLPVMHHSFLLNSTPDIIAQQFTLIEAELFKAVMWDELVSGRWKERTLEALDWETFFQRTGRRKAECIALGKAYKERAVDAIIARFNLMCGWVASEVVLTQNIEMRAKLLSKLIRVAWKCYEQHNHATLTQILLGLQFPAVERLHKTWARLPAKQRRIFKDLKTFTSPSRNFMYMRAAIQAKVTELGMVELMMTTGMSTSSTRNPFSLAPFVAPPIGGGDAGKSKRVEPVVEGFVPFFGLFTSTLASADALPTFIDPSAPSCPVDMDLNTGELRSLANPSAFDHLPPLPASIRVEPLVNLFKSRALALTVKTIVAFQERAALYSFEANRNLYVKCLKVRTLQGHQLASLSSFVEP
ncbi:hypothetical protein CF326_g2404 [Tilletia indica]|nr:hypothetical protein CF326_g2404 [Tilletia indica]